MRKSKALDATINVSVFFLTKAPSNLMLTEKMRTHIFDDIEGSYMEEGIIHKRMVTDNGD